MDRFVYTAMSGMQSSHSRLRVIANNMANAQTIGFRAELMQHLPITLKGTGLEARAATSSEVQSADLTAGALVQTGRALDIAMTGNAMLTVQAQDGGEAYSRRGDLTIAASGILVDGVGRPVMGESGPISIPPGQEISVSGDGSITAADPAAPDQPPQIVGRIKLVEATPENVAKGIDGQFRAVSGGILPQDLNAKLQSGYLEQSNVNPTEVLVEMIEAQRLFEMRSKLVSTARDIDQSGSSLMRINS